MYIVNLVKLASWLIYSYALIEYINRFAVDRMVMFSQTMDKQSLPLIQVDTFP